MKKYFHRKNTPRELHGINGVPIFIGKRKKCNTEGITRTAGVLNK